jgi:hypothetical protein
MQPREQSHVPFPEIPRLPGERKLEGVPHKASESVFNQPGVPDALDIHTETFGMNSAGRGVALSRHYARHRKVQSIESVALGLETIIDSFENPERSRHANFLASKLRNKAGTLATAASKQEVEVDDFYTDERNRPSYEMFTTEKRREIIEAAEAEPFRGDQNPIDDPDLKLEVSRLVRQQNCPDDEIITLGYKLAHRFVSPDQSTSEAARTFAALALAIDAAKIKAVGRKTSTMISNQIMWAATSEIAYMMPRTNAARAEVKQVRDNLGIPDNYSQWLQPKFDMLDSHMHKYLQVDWYIKRFSQGVTGKLRGFAVSARSRVEKEFSLDAEPARELAAELIRLRRYNVKPAYFSGDMYAKNSDESWVFTPSDQLLGAGWEERNRKVANPFLAHVDLASKSNPEKLVGELSTKMYGKKAQITIMNKGDFEPRLILGIYADGEIGLISGGNIRDIRSEFALVDKEDVYETLQMTLIKNLFDLVVPVEVVDSLPGHEQGPQKAGFFSKVKDAMDQMPIRDLVLARVKYIREYGTEIQDLIDRENNEQIRSLRDHSVVGHVRRLPAGFKPTPDAIALAESLGIKLAPNETFVRDHRRGNIENGSITSHRAVQVRSKV